MSLAIDVGAPGEPLTVEDFYDAIKAIESQEYPKPHRHLVSPAGMKRLSEGGRTCCHGCGAILDGSRDGII